MPGLLYTKIGYITVLCVSYKDNLNCRPANFKFAYRLLGQVYINVSQLNKYIIFVVNFNELTRVIVSTNLGHT